MSLLKTHFPGWYKEMLSSDAMTAWYNDPHNMNYAKSAYDKVMEALTAMKNVPMVGASGAVFGVLLAFGMMFPNQPIYIYFLIPLKAKYLVIIYGLFELYAAVAQPGSQVAHVAHIGGMIFGFILIKYWNRKKPNF
jgi:membrane associated rhomboid family serine protease